MKKLILFMLMCAACRAVAQNINVSGTVSDDKGRPVHYAFLYDPQTKNATYSDSTGAFNLVAASSSQLTVNARGHVSATVDVGGHTSLQITLKTDPAATNTAAKTDIDQAFKTRDGYTINSAVAGWGAVNSDTRDIVGSRFIFNKWVPGYIIKSDGSIAQNQNFLFNYDKMQGDLYYNENGKVTTNDKSVVKGFVLISPQDQFVAFELIPGISNDLYAIVLSSGPKYRLYKLIKTKYIPADYKTDGLASSGNKYDEYADDNTYYVMNVKTSAIQPLQLRKKSIKEAFAVEGDKLNSFMTAHSGDKIDDDYLKALGNALNQ